MPPPMDNYGLTKLVKKIEDKQNEESSRLRGVETGDEIHVLDSFKSKKDNKAMYKWRRAEVVGKRGTEIDIHFVGWSESWDETIDVSEQPQRIRHGDEEVPRGHVDANGDVLLISCRRVPPSWSGSSVERKMQASTSRLDLIESEIKRVEAEFQKKWSEQNDYDMEGEEEFIELEKKWSKKEDEYKIIIALQESKIEDMAKRQKQLIEKMEKLEERMLNVEFPPIPPKNVNPFDLFIKAN